MEVDAPPAPPEQSPPAGNQLGTFGGVFTPSILTILGVIMFMRASFVTGNAGILGAVVILLIAKGITFTTGLSLSAIGTNAQVRGGGAYYLISRVLGPEFGGAIGIALFFALALSVPFYILGFTEALMLSFPSLWPYFLTVTLGTAAVLFVVAFVGARWAIRMQYLIMGVLVLAILIFLGGAAARFELETFRANLTSSYSPAPGGGTYSFWLIFAIYFPAVTGIDAGVNMSGDLKDPARSLPRGTLAAIGVGFLVYLTQAVLCGGAFQREELVARPYEVLKDNALFGLGFAVAAGVFAATLSSALGSFLGAPRVLQAVSRDGILGVLRPFASGTPVTDEPRPALALTAVLTVGVLVWASLSGGAQGAALNSVAAIITMFFLYTYGMMNLAAFIEAFGKNPSFRPRFRYFHWSVALLGAIGCVATAFLIEWRAAIAAVLLIAALLAYLRTQSLETGFTDARRGFVFTSLRKNLLRLSETPEDSKNWRPTILVLSGNPSSREALVSFGVWLEAGRGIVFLARILVQQEYDARERRAAKEQLEAFCRERSLQAFPMVVTATDLGQGVHAVLETAGLGPVRPNMVLLGWAEEGGDLGNLGRYLRAASSLEMAVLLLKSTPDTAADLARVEGLTAAESVPERRIDVWWRGQRNGSLMLLMAHLLSRNWEWSKSTIRVMRVVKDRAEHESALAALDQLIHEARVQATPTVVVSEEPFADVLRRESEPSTVVFLGFDIPQAGEELEWHSRYTTLLAGMGTTTILVNSLGREDVTA